MKKRILIIEDDNMLSDIYKESFEQEGYEVLTAPNGANGITLAKEQKPDFILLDIMMPEMNGLEVFNHLMGNEETKNIPVAFLTVVAENVPESLMFDPQILEHAVGYWRKDKTTPPEIVNKVKEYLKD